MKNILRAKLKLNWTLPATISISNQGYFVIQWNIKTVITYANEPHNKAEQMYTHKIFK